MKFVVALPPVENQGGIGGDAGQRRHAITVETNGRLADRVSRNAGAVRGICRELDLDWGGRSVCSGPRWER